MSIQTCLKKSHTIWQHRAVAVIWQQCTDTQVALVCGPIATHVLSFLPDRHAERSLSALISWGISILDMFGYFYIALAFHLVTFLWKYGDLVVLDFSELCVMEDILKILVALSSLWLSNILPPWDKCIVFYWYEPPPLGNCLGRQHVWVSTHASYRAHIHSLHPLIWLQS